MIYNRKEKLETKIFKKLTKRYLKITKDIHTSALKHTF